MTDPSVVGRTVARIRDAQAISQNELADLLDHAGFIASRDHIMNWERGRVDITICELAEVLRICNTHKVIPLSRLENKLFLAMADPLNVLAIDDVRRITKLEVSPMIASEKAIMDKLHNLETGKTGSMASICGRRACP